MSARGPHGRVCPWTRVWRAAAPLAPLLVAIGCGGPAESAPEAQFLFEGDWVTVISGPFKLHHFRDDDAACPADLERAVDAYHAYLEFLGHDVFPDRGFEIYLFPDSAEGLSALAAACRQESLGCVGEGFVAGTDAALQHELVHFAQRDAGAGNRLINEGLATALACNPFMGSFTPPIFDWFAFEEEIARSDAQSSALYYVAGRFVFSLIDRFGMDTFQDFYAKVSFAEEREEVEITFLEVYGESLDDAWRTSRRDEFSQGCLPVVQCQTPLERPRGRCEVLYPGGSLEPGIAHELRVEGDFGVYACDGKGPDARVPWLSNENAWVYSDASVAVVRFSDQGRGSAQVAKQVERGTNDCADLALDIDVQRNPHLVIMPPIGGRTVRLNLSGSTEEGDWGFGYGSPDSIGVLDDGWADSPPILFGLSPSCEALEAGDYRFTWPVGEPGLIHLEQIEEGPYIFEIDQILPPSEY